MNGGRLDLLDSSRLVNQICGRERRVARGGRESVDHAPVAHDDLANAVLGAAVLCGRPAAPMLVALPESAAALLGDAWRRKQAPEELERLALLEKVAEHESAAGEALLRRYQESYDHAALDGLEAQHKAA